MTAYLDLEGEILTHVPQVDSILLEDAVRWAVQTFCEKTLVLEAETNPRLDLVAGVHTYLLPPVDGHTIVRIKKGGVFRYSGPSDTKPKRLDPTNPNELDGRTPPYHGTFRGPRNYPFASNCEDWRIATGTPELFFQPLPHQIRVVPIPVEYVEWALRVTYALKPDNDSTEVDDFVIDQWQKQIVIGSLAALLQIKHKPWTDVQEGVSYEKEFMQAIGKIVQERESAFESQDYTVGRVRAYT